MKEILFSQICPYVRFARELDEPIGSYFLGRAYDSRLFYLRRGRGNIFAAGVEYRMEVGDLLVFGPGTEYLLAPDPATRPEFIALNFDYVSEESHPKLPIPPDTVAQFDESAMLCPVTFLDVPALNAPLYLKNMESVDRALMEIKTEYETRRLFYSQQISGILLTVLTHIARVSLSAGLESSRSNHMADRIIAYICEHYDQELSCRMLGDMFHFHPNYINRLILRHTGMSTHQYILLQRISQAMKLIQTTDLSITQIAYRVGFRDLKHFSKMFKLKTGKAPSEFRMV